MLAINRGVRYEPKDDAEAQSLYVECVGGAADLALKTLYASQDAVQSSYRWARLGVLQRVLEAGFSVSKNVVYGGAHDVRLLMLDEGWLKGWPEPAKIMQVLVAMGDALEVMRKGTPRMLRRETMMPPRVLAAVQPKLVRSIGK